MTYIVAFHALPRAGKTTASEPLMARGFFKASFGDGIYDELSAAFGVSVEKLRSNEWKTEPQPALNILRCRDSAYVQVLLKAGYDVGSPRTSRFHLQRYATEYRRAQDKMYWTKQVDEKIRYLSCDIVIDDLRFIDTEYPYLRNLAEITGRELKVIEILRPSSKYDQIHVSDTRLPFHLIDHVVENIEGMPDVLQGDILNYLYPTGE